MIEQFRDNTVICPDCGCTTMFVQETCQVTETIKNGKPVSYEKHAPKITLVCQKCGAVVREYDMDKILKVEKD